MSPLLCAVLDRARERRRLLRWTYNEGLETITIDVDGYHTLVYGLTEMQAFCDGLLVGDPSEVPA